jgi:hypothetical protein
MPGKFFQSSDTNPEILKRSSLDGWSLSSRESWKLSKKSESRKKTVNNLKPSVSIFILGLSI